MIGNIIAAWIMSRGSGPRRYPSDDGFAFIILGILTSMVVAVMLLRYLPFIAMLWYVSLGALIVSTLACAAFPDRGGVWSNDQYVPDPRALLTGGFFGLSVLLIVVTGLAYLFHA